MVKCLLSNLLKHIVFLQEFFPLNKQTQEMFEKHFIAHGLEKLVEFQVGMHERKLSVNLMMFSLRLNLLLHSVTPRIMLPLYRIGVIFLYLVLVVL